ncbi:DNA ligase [Enterovibrio makurazakiensis]|uniref:DNA ligase n=1 Tax=Enterovibrio gelatinilyticus TaxID=2899819 RepID=A0ABT5QU76_9GAMM|nr:DNA ligase [Enterovibrio sp. ZSDZ42]MDD1791572.1 DNA ligase [Enterovibrio sp. ZSDZ42]
MNKYLLAGAITSVLSYQAYVMATESHLASGKNSKIVQKDKAYIPIQLASEYRHGMAIDWADYLFSEKLDGIRAIWTGERLITRQGNQISAPAWFTEALPPYAVEGELWSGRNRFEHIMSVVMDDTPNDDDWQTIQFMLFDLPTLDGDFTTRFDALVHLVNSTDSDHIQYVPHFPSLSEHHIERLLRDIDGNGGEGLMLRKMSSGYLSGRSDNVLKFKISKDAEALVVGYHEGKGKHQGRMGSLMVKTDSGKVFKIGTGFSDKQRENPPEIGSMVTFRYNGYTKNGIPKFARFMRVDETKQ